MTEATSDGEQVMSEYDALFNGDFSKVDVLAESIALRSPTVPGGEVHGRDAVEEVVRGMHSAFSNFEMTADDMLTGNGKVMVEWTMSGIHEGEFRGAPPTGNEIEVTGMSKILITDGKVQEDRIYVDSKEMFEQLGLTES